MYKKILIPENLNVDELLQQVDGNATHKENIRNGLIYFVSLLTVDNYYHHNNGDGFKFISGQFLDNIIGKGSKRPTRVATIKKLLVDNNVIEIKNYRVGNNCTGFKLTERYSIGTFVEVELSQKILDNINMFDKHIDVNDEPQYSILIDQFNKNELTIDEDKIHQFIKNIGHEVLSKIEQVHYHQTYNYKSALNYFGRLINLIEDIKTSNYHITIAMSNGRFHSNLTSFPRIFRPFLLINGEGVGEVDIMSSQPFILSTILNSNFFTNENEGFNLQTTYPELKDKMVNVNLLLDENNIQEYGKIDFTNDYYDFIASNSGDENFNRDYVKKHNMNYLFQKKNLIRNKNKLCAIMNNFYPGVSNFIRDFHKLNGNQLALLLQRCEVYLILKVCERISIEHPNTTFFTIHDSILTTKENLPHIEMVMKNVIKDVTGKEVGLKSKILIPNIEIDNNMVNEIFNKVLIKEEEKWNKIKTYILKNNVYLAIKYFNINNNIIDNINI